MSDDDTDDDAAPYDAEGEFLSIIWRHLDQAEELSILPEALAKLDEVARHCEAVVKHIRARQADHPFNA